MGDRGVAENTKRNYNIVNPELFPQSPPPVCAHNTVEVCISFLCVHTMLWECVAPSCVCTHAIEVCSFSPCVHTML